MSIFKLVRLTSSSHFVNDVKFNNDVRTLHHQIDISHRYVDIMIGTVIRLIFRMRNCNTVPDYESLKLGGARLKR